MRFHFEQLEAWQEAVNMARLTYQVSNKFPTREQFGLTSQLRRAAVSISANIAEGKGRFHKREFVHFLYVARGSLYETITLCKVAVELGYIQNVDEQEVMEQCKKVASKLSGLINFLKSEIG